MSAGRVVWVKVRASEAERAEWHAKARSAGLTLSDLVRRSVDRVHTWTVAHADVERELTQQADEVKSGVTHAELKRPVCARVDRSIHIRANGRPADNEGRIKRPDIRQYLTTLPPLRF